MGEYVHQAINMWIIIMHNQRIIFSVILLIISCNLLGGCILFQSHNVGYAVANQVDSTGLTKRDVLIKYGWPNKKETTSSDGSSEVYIYEEEHWGRMYLYFKDGIVASTRFEKIPW